MTTAVIGATGRVGSEIIRGLPARGDAVTVLVRDHGKGAAPSANPTGCTSACAVPPSHKTAGADASPVVSAAETRACSRSSACESIP